MELTLEDIIRKLAGPVRPCGDSNEDSKRFENLKEYCILAEGMVREINALTRYSDSYEFSVKKAGEYAQKSIAEIKEIIGCE